MWEYSASRTYEVTGDLCPSLDEVAESVGVGGLWGSTRSESIKICGCWSELRGPGPECPLIIPWEARNDLIFSRK